MPKVTKGCRVDNQISSNRLNKNDYGRAGGFEMPQISIVIPHLGQTELLEQTLVSVLQNRPRDCEVLVPHSGYADPYKLNDEVHFIEIPRRASVSYGFNAAIEQCNSEVVHWLSNGAEVEEGWCDWAIAHFQDPYVGCVTPLVVERQDRTQIISAGLTADLFFRKKTIARGLKNPQKLKRLDPVGPTFIGAFYRKSALQQIHKLETFGASTIDLEIALALREMGFESKLETDCQVMWDSSLTAAVSPLRSGLEMQRTIWRYAALDGPLKSLLVTAAAATLEIGTGILNPANLLRVCGRLAALTEIGRYRQFHKLIENAPGPQLGQSSQRSLKIGNDQIESVKEPIKRAA